MKTVPSTLGILRERPAVRGVKEPGINNATNLERARSIVSLI
jgi:hypothetical protein